MQDVRADPVVGERSAVLPPRRRRGPPPGSPRRSRGQHLCEVDRAQRAPAPLEPAPQVQEARRVARADTPRRPSPRCVGASSSSIAVETGRVPDRERPAEAAALRRVPERPQLEPRSPRAAASRDGCRRGAFGASDTSGGRSASRRTPSRRPSREGGRRAAPRARASVPRRRRDRAPARGRGRERVRRTRQTARRSARRRRTRPRSAGPATPPRPGGRRLGGADRSRSVHGGRTTSTPRRSRSSTVARPDRWGERVHEAGDEERYTHRRERNR